MENLTYKAYQANPEIRDHIEREVRRARAESVRQIIAAPIARMFTRMFNLFQRAPRKSPRAIPMPS